MPTGTRATAYGCLEFVDLPCIRGGHLKSPVVLPLVQIPCQSGEMVEFAPISKDESWLFLSVSGSWKT